MKPEIKKKWVNALRSGEYKKSTGQLSEDVNGKQCFCALGVLEDLYNTEHNLNWDKATRQQGVPSFGVKEWAEYDADKEKIEYGDFEDNKEYIYHLNDAYELSFNEIADIIEAQL